MYLSFIELQQCSDKSSLVSSPWTISPRRESYTGAITSKSPHPLFHMVTKASNGWCSRKWSFPPSPAETISSCVCVWTNQIGPTFLQFMALENPINIKAQFNHDKGGIKSSISDHIATALTGLWMIRDSLIAIMMANELPSTPQTKHLEKADWSGPESWVPSVCIS